MRFLKVFVLILILTFSFNVNAQLFPGQVVRSDGSIGTPTAEWWNNEQKLIKALNGSTFINTIEDYTNGSDRGCWFCPIFDNLFNISNNMAMRLYEPLKNICIYLLAMGFSFYLLFKMINYYISFGAIDPRGFFTELLRPFFYMILAIMLISNIQSFFDYVITPMVEMAVGFSQQLIETATVSGTVGEFKQYTSSLGSDTVDAYCGEGGFNDVKFGLGEGVHDAIKCVIQKVSASVLVHMAVGSTFIKDSWEYRDFIFPKWNMLSVGLMIWICSFTIFVAFPFKLVDSMIRLIFVMALLPLWIVCWVLPATRKYSSKAFEMFFQSLMVFISLSACMIMIFHILEVSFVGMGGSASMGTFMNHLKEGKTIEAWHMAYFGGKFFSIYFALMIICFSLLKKIESFASHFVGGGNLGIGESMEKAALSFAVQKPLSLVAKPAVNKIVEKTGGFIGKKIGSAIGRFRKDDEASSASPESESGSSNPNQSQNPTDIKRFKPTNQNSGAQENRKTESGRPDIDARTTSSKGRRIYPSGEIKPEKIGWKFWRLFKRKSKKETERLSPPKTGESKK